MSQIVFHQIGMRFRLFVESSHTLKEALVSFVRGKNAYRDLWALEDITMTVRQGESVGIIGKNGSGKSTLLRLLAGVFEPTVGSHTVAGTVAPLIELGAGFNGELTGRENVFLSGALLGRTRSQMHGLYADIVAFSELGEFMDVPVKNYSSGMYARLGFAIATSVSADILLIDEILGVGDEAFQKKSFSRIRQHLDEGKTLLFVSHDAAAVERLCSRAIVLHHGRLVFDGPTAEALREYRRMPSMSAVVA
jgi:lipopolysaccharide transport system ATP-binding protein